MKLVININAYNEEKTLPVVLKELPKKISGIDVIEVQVIDDGSQDRTAEVARKHGAKVYSFKHNLGLGRAFKFGMDKALENGADIMVNTDADNQYPGRYVEKLVKPVLDRKADMVVGDRRPWTIKHFSPTKRFFQYVGNRITRVIAGTDVQDTVSGFRAYSRDTLLRLNIVTKFSYVLDVIVQAEQKGLKVVSVPISVNPPTRESRLFKNIFQHMKISAANIVRLFVIYEPFKTFILLSIVVAFPAVLLSIRFIYYFYMGQGGGHIQSLIAAAILYTFSGLLFSLGIIGDIISINRKLSEEQMYLVRKKYYG